MAILRSLDGRFYEVPDDQVSQFLIPEDRVKEKLEGSGAPMVPPSSSPPEAGPPGPPPGSPTIVVQIFGGASMPGPGAPPPSGTGTETTPEVQPYYWNNWWHNVKGNWNNWWHNVHR
jgi:hypothetical protein